MSELALLGRPLRNIGVLLAGNILRLGLGFLASALTYRVLTPEDAGRFTLILTLVGLFSIFAEFGFRDAAVNYIAGAASPAEAQTVARSFLVAKLLFGTLAAALLALLAHWILGRWYPGRVDAGLIQFAALSLLTGGLLNYMQTLLEARQNFGALSLLSTLQAGVRAAAIAFLFFTGRVALLPLLAVEVFIPLLLLAYGQRFLPREFLSLRGPLFAAFERMWRFSRWIAIAAIAATIFLRLDVLLLGHFHPEAEVGVYGVALALLGKFAIVENALLTTTFPDACRYTAKSDLRRYVRRTVRLTGLISLGFVLLLPLARWLLLFLYGAAYERAALPFGLLLVSFVIALNFQPAAYVLYPLNRPQWIATSDVLQLMCSVGLGLWLIPIYGATGAALTVLGTRIVGAGLIFGLVIFSLR
jgi:O-antigen/teichoic acid export membrane protein